MRIEVTPSPVLYDLWVDGELILLGESFTLVDQVRNILEEGWSAESTEAREIAESILNRHATRVNQELEAAVEEMLCEP